MLWWKPFLAWWRLQSSPLLWSQPSSWVGWSTSGRWSGGWLHGATNGYTGATNGYTGATNGSQRARGANWPQLDHWWSAQAISREPKSKHTLMVAHSSIIWTSCTNWWPVALFQKPVYTTCVTTQNEDGSKVNAILSSGASVKLSWEPTANAPFYWSFCPLHHLWHRHTGTLEV